MAAVHHLVKRGWVIVERNWRCSLGEVDIIAHTGGDDPVLVFCEVKCRTGRGYGDPLDRPAESVLEDVREGYVSIDAALVSYGVVLAGDPLVIDHAATERERGRRRAEQAGGVDGFDDDESPEPESERKVAPHG